MRSKLDWEDGRVGDADVREAVHLEVRVDDAALLAGEHRARARRVVLGPDVLLQPRVPVRVGLHVRTGNGLVADRGAQRLRSGDLARELEAFAEDDGVGKVREVLGVDGRRREGVVRGDVDTAGREWVLERGLDGDAARGVEREEDLDLSDGAEEERVGVRLVDRLITLLDLGGVAGDEV